MVFNRPIIASTRVRTCSFLCSSEGAFRGKRFVSLTQRAVLFLQVFDGGDELFDALGKSHQLEIELSFCCIAHA